MSDDQGDADFEASLANLGNAGDTGAPRPAAGDGALAARIESLSAGLHEDLLQVRAIASAIAERDLTDDLHAVRSTVEELAARDPNAPVRNDLAALRDMVVTIQASDPAGELRAELEPLRAGIDRIAEQLSDDSAYQRLLERLGELADRLQAMADADRSDELLQRIDELSTREQIRGLAADLRAHLADAIGGLDGDSLSAEMREVKDTVTQGSQSVAETLDRLQETLLDVASGEVVGALWDEFRGLRDHLEVRDRLEELRTEPAPTVADEPEPAQALGADTAAALDGLHQQLDALRDALDRVPAPVAGGRHRGARGRRRRRPDLGRHPGTQPRPQQRDRRDPGAGRRRRRAARVGDAGNGHAGRGHRRSDPARAGRPARRPPRRARRRARGRAVRGPHDHARGAAGRPRRPALRTRVAALDPRGHRRRAGAARRRAGARRRRRTARRTCRPPAAGDADASRAPPWPTRSPPCATTWPPSSTACERSSARPPAPAPSDEPVQAGLDPDTLDLLREEIRAAGAVPDQVLDALRQELKALRRRLAVKAQERVLSDEQLRAIADAVAERLHQD